MYLGFLEQWRLKKKAILRRYVDGLPSSWRKEDEISTLLTKEKRIFTMTFAKENISSVARQDEYEIVRVWHEELSALMATDNFKSLHKDERYLIERQHKYQGEYLKVLSVRLTVAKLRLQEESLS